MKKIGKFQRIMSYILGSLIITTIVVGCVALIFKCIRYII